MAEPSGDFWDDLLQEFKTSDEIAKLDKDSTLAEMVECLLGEPLTFEVIVNSRFSIFDHSQRRWSIRAN